MDFYILVGFVAMAVIMLVETVAIVNMNSDINKMKKQIDTQNFIQNTIVKHYENYHAQYSEIVDMYNKMVDCYARQNKMYEYMCKYTEKLSDQHDKLLTCWSDVEERYSEAYEQFQEYNRRLKTLEIYCLADAPELMNHDEDDGK